MKVSEENFDECRENCWTSAFVDEESVCPLEIPFLVFQLGKLIACDGFHVKQYHIRFYKIISRVYYITYNVCKVN